MRVFPIIWLLALLPQSTEPYKHQLDLESMLRNTQALQKLTIMYDSPTQHGFQLLFVRGDGSLILQWYPERPVATTGLPTCKAKIAQDEVKKLVSSMVSRHFWELPEKNFLFIGSPSHGEPQIHQIVISNGTEKAGRVFGVGVYGGKQESIPDDFATIEQQLKELAQSTFSDKPCHLAPAVQF
jgi:hypothetical protein